MTIKETGASSPGPSSRASQAASRTIPTALWVLSAWAVVLLVGLVIFQDLFQPGRLLFTTDDNIGQIAMRKTAIADALGGGWWDGELLGQQMIMNVNLTTLLLWLLPVDFYYNWIHLIDLGLASLFFILFLREHRRSWLAAIGGTLVALWLGHFSIVYAGHLGKFGMLIFASAFLWACAVAVRTKSMAWSALAGGALGGMFMEQADIGFVMALGLGFYPIHAWARKHGFGWRGLLRHLAPMYLTGLLLAMPSLLSGYRVAVKDDAVVRGGDSKAKWEFITQWSLPPEDLLDLAAPNYHGIRSGEPEGPYWGRIGRSEGWEKTGQGFMNFRLDSSYIGMIPLVFAVFAFIPALRARIRSGRSGPPIGGERIECHVLFFSLFALLSLLFSMGKFTPVYRLLYALPIVGDVRAPVKFMQVFQLALGVVSAYGFDLALRGLPPYLAAAEFQSGRRKGDRSVPPRWLSIFPGAVAVVAGAFLLGALTLMNTREASMPAWASQWGTAATAIWNLRIGSLWHAAFMGALAAAGIAAATALRRSGKSTLGLALAATAVVAADAVAWSRDYVQTMRKSQVAGTAAVVAMKDESTHGRVALLTQQGFYNSWLTYLFPYHAIPSINISQMPRMPEDYRAFLGVAGPRPPVLWDLAAVTRIAGPREWMEQMQREPSLQGRLRPLLSYDLRVTAAEDVVVESRPDGRGEHAVFAYTPAMPRFCLVAHAQTVPRDEALRRMADPAYIPGRPILISPAPGGREISLPDPNFSAQPIPPVTVRACRSGYFQLRTDAPQGTVLRVAEKFDPGWMAWVDGREVPVAIADYICMAVQVPPGPHEVVFRQRHDPLMRGLTVAGMGIVFLAVLGAAAGSLRSRRSAGVVGTDECAGGCG